MLSNSRCPQDPAIPFGFGTCLRDMISIHRIHIAADYRTARRPARDLHLPTIAVHGNVSGSTPHAAIEPGRANFPGGYRNLRAGFRNCGRHIDFGLGMPRTCREPHQKPTVRRVGTVIPTRHSQQ